MKNSLHFYAFSLLRFSVVAGILCLLPHAHAQDNVWTGTTSGNWQDASWSLGVPGANQTIWVTNAGWKAVQIGADTANSFPQSLNVDAINIASPVDSFNTLLLNDAGAATPLTVKTLTVASNSSLQMVSSALQINGPNGSGMLVGGSVEHNDSLVAGNQVNVGYIGSGVYNFNSGYFTVSQLWLGGGAHPGVFNQNGGTNGFGITHLDGGTYVLSNGWYGATIDFDTYGHFCQLGGLLTGDLTLFHGSYALGGGIHQGSATVPSQNAFTTGFANVLQTGGTNYGSFDIGSYGYGTYTLSNGVSYATNFSIGHGGSYFQAGGTQIINGTINIDEQQISYASYEGGSFNLNDGQISSTGIYSRGYYTQTGGTNVVAGDITLVGAEDTSLALSGGLLSADNLSVSPGYTGGVIMSGGTLLITNTLSLQGSTYFPQWCGFVGGGELVVSNISLAPAALFACGNGVIKQSGTLTLANANFYSATNSVQLGALCLASGGNTNSTLYLVSPASIVNFANSSSMTWSNEPMLIIEGWAGSLFGGGAQQIIFGQNSNALTSTQLAHIQFHNPAGLTNGMYAARILPNGEIVPAVSGSALPASMALQSQPGGMKVTLQGEAGRTYTIETSTDLVHWAPWTNIVNSTGTMNVMDTDAANYPARYYRAHLMP